MKMEVENILLRFDNHDLPGKKMNYKLLME